MRFFKVEENSGHFNFAHTKHYYFAQTEAVAPIYKKNLSAKILRFF